MWAKKIRGFSLLELMIVVAIVAVLAALAYDNYSRYAFRSRRVDGQNLLTSIASAEQRYYTNFNKYTATIAGSGSTSLDFTDAYSNPPGQYYSATAVVASGGQTYTLTATPVAGKAQAKDKCLNLTLTDAGQKSQSGNQSNGNCW
ncbi:MAG: type IV pilin protein [Rudaea sp.]